MSRKSIVSRALLLAAVALFVSLPLHAGDFKNISPEELVMKDNPAAPGAHAMILEWTMEEDDVQGSEYEYIRMKIFTDQGKKHADIEIPYRDGFTIGDIKARTVQPDGTIVPFTAKVFDKVLLKTRNYQYKAKTFSFPDVRPGSILEYRYRRTWDNRILYSTHWDLQKKLFIKKATLSLKPVLDAYYYATYISVLAPGTKQPENKNHVFLLNLENVPAFEDEEYSLPEAQLMPHIDFFYRDDSYKSADEYWQKYGKEAHKAAEDFIGNRGGIRQAAAALVAPGDDNDTKLGKIYARVQQIRNLSYESSKTEAEQSRVTPKENKNVEDVLKNGYGYRNQINRLFVALVRGVGLEAAVVRVSQRDAQIFQKNMFDDRQLDGEIAVAQGNAGDVVLDPSTPFCPFGMLSWENTGVQALRLDKTGGVFFTTQAPASSEAITRRMADLKLDEEGSLSGKVMVEYEGQRALRERLNALETDEVELRKSYEKDIEDGLPQGSKAKLAKIESARDSSKPLRLEFDVTIPNITSSVGSRTLLPLEVFQARSSNPFEFAQRRRPVYFRYPFQEIESVRVTLPDGMKVESVPKPALIKEDFAYYDANWQNGGNFVSVVRRRAIGEYIYHQNQYPALRQFYSQVNSSDRENLVLRQGQ